MQFDAQTVTYPTGMRIQELPEHAIVKDIPHASAAIQKGRKHALPMFYDGFILLCLCRFGGIVCD